MRIPSNHCPRTLGRYTDSYVRDAAAGGGGNPNFDISPDGRQFVCVDRQVPNVVPSINVVLNWQQELIERVPVP